MVGFNSGCYIDLGIAVHNVAEAVTAPSDVYSMSLATSTQLSLPTLNFNTPQWDVNGPQIRETFVIPALTCGLYGTDRLISHCLRFNQSFLLGIFVLLCGASIYSLVQYDYQGLAPLR